MRPLVLTCLGFVLLAGAIAGPVRAQEHAPVVAADSLAAPVDTTLAHPAAADMAVTPTAAPHVDALAQVVALEQQRRAAMVAGDTRTLSGILAEDATYVHSTGIMQTRDELFRLLENKTIRYLKFDVEKTSYRVYGNLIVGTGVQRVEVMSGGKSLVLHSRYTVVYTMRDGTEKLVAYQSTSMPEMVTKTK
jgi:hypothetical protein